MFCSSCGKEIYNEAVVCPYCGAKTINAQQIPQQPNFNAQQNYSTPQQYPQQFEADETNVGIVVLSVLFPMVGIILGALNLSNGKKKSGKAYLMAGIISAVVCILIGVILGVVIASNPHLKIAWNLI